MLYGLFKDSSARNADYTEITRSTSFSRKFCQVNWLENVDVVTRALDTFPFVQKYMKNAKLPQNVTCNNVAAAIADPLTLAKLAFFFSVAALFQSFVGKYQTAKSMIIFVFNNITNLLQNLLKFAKQSVMKASGNCFHLMKIDLNDRNNIMNYKEVDIGVAAVRYLSSSKVFKSHEDAVQKQVC